MRGHSCFYCGSHGQGDETREGDTVTDRQGGWVVNSKKRSLQSWTAAFQGVGCTDSHTPTSGRLRPLVKRGAVLHPLTCRPHEHPIYYCTSSFHFPFCLFEVYCLRLGRSELRPWSLVGVGAKRKSCGAQKCCVNTGSERLIFYYL